MGEEIIDENGIVGELILDIQSLISGVFMNGWQYLGSWWMRSVGIVVSYAASLTPSLQLAKRVGVRRRYIVADYCKLLTSSKVIMRLASMIARRDRNSGPALTVRVGVL